MLKIEHLTKKYGAKVAVDDLSLEIKPGEIYGFIGHNGAGKTTTIRCACGLLDFDEGEITINGRSIREDPLACKMDFAYIPDNPVLFDFLSGIDYLNFIGDVYKVEKSVREERIRRYSDTFEITSNLAQPISSYSHGMKQKLAIVAAMLHEPKLFVLDEPFVG
ncbi:MAG: ABC transporter ATP-binding protein, partial [Erysipelotrichaceae bacterium]|nr:ABC transporter ATP-binding protein [Erysipelotrichaceae bacterium]